MIRSAVFSFCYFQYQRYHFSIQIGEVGNRIGRRHYIFNVTCATKLIILLIEHRPRICTIVYTLIIRSIIDGSFPTKKARSIAILFVLFITRYYIFYFNMDKDLAKLGFSLISRRRWSAYVRYQID